MSTVQNPGPPGEPQSLPQEFEPARYDAPFSGRKMFLLALAAALLVFLVGAGLDEFVLKENASRALAISISDSLTAVIAGALVFRILQYERERRRRLRQRLEVIAEMNHHVRNALQVISLSAYSTSDQRQLAAVKESVGRIQWALREILPKL